MANIDDIDTKLATDSSTTHAAIPNDRLQRRQSYIATIIVLCLQVSVSLCQLPVTGISTASANTGTGFDTTFGTADDPKVTLSDMISDLGTDKQVFIVYQNKKQTFKLFNKDGDYLATQYSYFDDYGPKIYHLKDPLKIMMIHRQSIYQSRYTVTINGGLYSISGIEYVIQSVDGLRAGFSDPTSDYLYYQENDARVLRLNIYGGGTVVNTNFASGLLCEYMEIRQSQDNIVEGLRGYWNYNDQIGFAVLSKSDLQQVKKGWYQGVKTQSFILDNLNDNYLYGINLNNGYIYSIDLVNSSVGGITFGDFAEIVEFGTSRDTNILNFGPYQYVVTIPNYTDGKKKLIFVPKAIGQMANVIVSSLYQVNKENWWYTLTGFIASDDRYYFGQIEKNSGNFQSYYLTVDRCVNRDGSFICTQCLPGYYRVTTNPNNACQAKAEFAPGIGVDTTGTMLANPCIETPKCLACLDDIKTCTQCDISNMWHLKTSDGKCYSPLAAMLIPDGWGINLSTTQKYLSQCQVTGCLDCKTDHTACFACKKMDGWYLKVNICQHTSLSPIFSSGTGPNTMNGNVEPCSNNCIKCSATIAQCTLCNSGFDLSNSLTCLTSHCNPGEGNNLGNSNIPTTCAVSNCKSCCADHTKCIGCDPPTNWFLNAPDNKCETPDQLSTNKILSGEGANLQEGTVVACKDANCLKCFSNYQQCTECKTGASWYLNIGNGAVCQSTITTNTPSIADRFGANGGTGKVEACNDINCIDCRSDFATCVTCDTANYWYLSGSSCLHTIDSPRILDRQGANTTAGTVVSCSDSNCIDCRPAFASCITCDTLQGWYLNQGIPQCLHATDSPTMPAGYGPDLLHGVVVACDDGHCLDCLMNMKICRVCDVSSGWYLAGNECQHASIIPKMVIGTGADISDSTVKRCLADRCIDCFADHSKCQLCNTEYFLSLTTDRKCECDIASGYYFDIAAQVCVHFSSLLNAGKGGDNSSKSVKPCASKGCVNCNADIESCDLCDNDNKYYLQNDRCVFVNDIVPGRGADINSGKVEKCTVTGCLTCQGNRNSCTQCNLIDGYILKNSTCEKVVLVTKLESAVFSAKKSSAEITFSTNLDPKTKVDLPLMVIFKDTVNNQQFTCEQIKCEVEQIKPKGFVLRFISPEAIIKGELLIQQSKDLLLRFEDGSVWTDYPILVPDISFIKKNAATATATSAMTTLNSARMPISIAIAFFAPAAASFLDTLINTLFLLKMLEGPIVSFAEMILEVDMEVNMIPIDLPNPFQSWLSNADDCHPSVQFEKHKIDCNLLANQGVTLAEITGVLVVTALISWLSNLILRAVIRRVLRKDRSLNFEDLRNADLNEHSPNKPAQSVDVMVPTEHEKKTVFKKSRAARLVHRIGGALGMQFFLIKLEGLQIEMSLLSMLGVHHSSATPPDAISTLISLAFLIYYTVVAALCFHNSLWIWSQVEALRDRDGPEKVYKKPLGHVILLSRAPHSLVNYNFEKLKVPDHYWKLLLPVTSFLGTTAMCVILVTVIGKAWQQVTLVAMVISFMLAFEVMTDSRFNKSEHWADIGMRGFTLAYLLLKCWSTSPHISEKFRQEKLGILMMACLCGIIFIGVTFALYSIGLMFIQTIQIIIGKWKAFKELKRLMKSSQTTKHNSSLEKVHEKNKSEKITHKNSTSDLKQEDKKDSSTLDQLNESKSPSSLNIEQELSPIRNNQVNSKKMGKRLYFNQTSKRSPEQLNNLGIPAIDFKKAISSESSKIGKPRQEITHDRLEGIDANNDKNIPNSPTTKKNHGPKYTKKTINTRFVSRHALGQR